MRRRPQVPRVEPRSAGLINQRRRRVPQVQALAYILELRRLQKFPSHLAPRETLEATEELPLAMNRRRTSRQSATWIARATSLWG